MGLKEGIAPLKVIIVLVNEFLTVTAAACFQACTKVGGGGNQAVLTHSRVRVIGPRYSHNHSVTHFPVCMRVQCQHKDKRSRASLSCIMKLPSGEFLSPLPQMFLLHNF